MCWTTENFPRRKKAKENIPIFKILRKGQIAFFNLDFKYTLGKRYETRLASYYSLVIDYLYRQYTSIFKGFHSYGIDLNTELLGNSYIIHLKDNTTINYYVNENVIIAYGIIPKGTTYYVNESGEYVSNKIIIYNTKKLFN